MPTPVRNFALIRFSLLAGVLLFGAASWYVVGQRGGGPQAGRSLEDYAVLRTLVPVLCVAALGAAVAVRVAIGRTRDAERRNSLRMIGWAAGEGAALAGGIYYFMTGEPKLYLVGLLAMLATLIVVPLREA